MRGGSGSGRRLADQWPCHTVPMTDTTVFTIYWLLRSDRSGMSFSVVGGLAQPAGVPLLTATLAQGLARR